MILVYIAGPFRGKDAWTIEQNIRRAESLAFEVWALGAVGIAPHTLVRWEGAVPNDLVMKGELEILKRCNILLLTSDWRASEGSRAEHRAALTLGIPVVYSIEELSCLLKGNPSAPTADASTTPQKPDSGKLDHSSASSISNGSGSVTGSAVPRTDSTPSTSAVWTTTPGNDAA